MAKKAVLIFDMPKGCSGCPCYNGDFDWCNTLEEPVIPTQVFDSKLPGCPLIETTNADLTRVRIFLSRIENEKENRL